MPGHEPLDVRLLGRTPYFDTLALQRRLQQDVRAGTAPETLLLTEHEPVITLGRAHATPALRASAADIAACGVPIVASERGGDITFHGPGQLVAYAVIDLRRRSLGAADFVAILEDAVISMLSTYSVEGHREPSARGVWAVAGPPPRTHRRKIASVGINVRAGVTMHGIAINLATSLSGLGDGFDLINPCGDASTEMTSIEGETGHPVSLESAASRFAEGLLEILGAATPRSGET